MSQTPEELFLAALVEPLQGAADMEAQVRLGLTVDAAVGVQLTAIGKIVGVARNGVTDDDIFRRHVRAQIATNSSHGTIENLITIASLIVYDEAATFVIDNHGIAALTMSVEDVAVTFAISELLMTFLRRAVAGGVRIILETQNHTDADAFTFDTYAGGGGTGKGFQDYAETGLGGKLGNALE